MSTHNITDRMRIEFTHKGELNGITLWVTIITTLLLLLWIPVLIYKIVDLRIYRLGILYQPFSTKIGYYLVWILPALELITVILLVSWRKTMLWGLWLSFSLLLAYTIYAGIAHIGNWASKYCDCGRIISKISWGQHFWLNLFFLSLSGIAIYLENIIRGGMTKGNATEGGSATRQIYKN